MRGLFLAVVILSACCPEDNFEAFVDYTQPASTAKREFDWVNPMIDDKFSSVESPGNDRTPVKFEYMEEKTPDDGVSLLGCADAVRGRMAEEGLRPATLAEGRGFAKRYKNEQRSKRIVLLTGGWGSVPVLGEDLGERILDFVYLGTICDDCQYRRKKYYFLAVQP